MDRDDLNKYTCGSDISGGILEIVKNLSVISITSFFYEDIKQEFFVLDAVLVK